MRPQLVVLGKARELRIPTLPERADFKEGSIDLCIE